ncbi:sulfur carrier protein ThiS [Pseudoteredinibacter isoporae]|uniref:Sulfur carrier protein n=1 Tax=Pseudoteredinibacter isoporae TaxID=570281 RepID=A0A7X0JXN6_9GAMM|nr:sulfur carrier protein ThiS [Pseudoteredinibacter isoporae]MBB6523176.1 sulfur carrier protein [Pseudoteredinibacter isoporae]NHO88694.1 sulfur carrier protein ThiS [Pseudoteredinibacter isoporae]NIB22615.1 sulfur carrier protein ThiS [Pseudoteredinibacter isoporae]
MHIVLNGKAVEIPQPDNLQDFFDSLNRNDAAIILPKQFAVALNAQFIPRSQYADTALQEGDDLELLVPMQGG